MCVRLLSFVERLLVIQLNIAIKLWEAFSKLFEMNGSSFLYVGSFKSYPLLDFEVLKVRKSNSVHREHRDSIFAFFTDWQYLLRIVKTTTGKLFSCSF